MITEEITNRLLTERNMWLATVRPSGRPHLVPIWFIWQDGFLYVCMQQKSVKARNLANNPLVSLSLEDGDNVVICEGSAEKVAPPYTPAVVSAFQAKYNWNITTDGDYNLLLQITPKKWLTWKGQDA